MVIAFLASVILSLFATAVMSYISMAIPIGPWIAPTVVLLALGLFKVFSSYRPAAITRYSVLATCAASIGGITATGIGFSYPAIYFLSPNLFEQWLKQPLLFSSMLTGLAATAGALGIWFAHVLVDQLIVRQQLAFPIGDLVYKMIAAHQSARKSLELIGGFLATTVFCALQDGIGVVKSILPKSFMLISTKKLGVLIIPALQFHFWPLLWAIGFVTGHVITLPLAVGAVAKIFVVDATNYVLFPTITNMDFVLAFCSGMVLAGTLQGFVGLPSALIQTVRSFFTTTKQRGVMATSFMRHKRLLIEGIVIIGLVVMYLWIMRFSFMAQSYLVLFTLIVSYQLAIIAGKIGLAPLGRFATFVMVPAMLLFHIDVVQIIIIATFVEICGGVVADALFSLKMAQLGGISRDRLRRYQYLGLVISALSVGIIFWQLIVHFNLGSTELFAQKAQTRALLINVQSFDVWVLAIGVIFGLLLKYIKLNPALVLSGILMPLHLSIGLITGGLLTLLVNKKEEWYPLWSGIFAANSIWMLLRTLW